jgi:hypothetical protein
MLVVAATSGAPRTTDEEHTHIMRQRQRRLPLHQPHSALAHKAYARPARFDDLPVRGYLHEGSTHFSVLRV